MTESAPPPPRRTERKALIVAAIVAAVVLVLFLVIDGSRDTQPTVSEGGESPATEAPSGQEPPQPMTDE